MDSDYTAQMVSSSTQPAIHSYLDLCPESLDGRRPPKRCRQQQPPGLCCGCAWHCFAWSVAVDNAQLSPIPKGSANVGQRLERFQHVTLRKGADLPTQGVRLVARMDNMQVGQAKISESVAHGGRDLG